MSKGRFLSILLVLVILACGTLAYGYQAERTPEYALQEIMTGVVKRDQPRVEKYVDMDRLLASTYDESTAILVRDIEKLHRLYPQDWFFRHDSAFMQKYIADRRDNDLKFIKESFTYFWDEKKLPVGKTQGEAKWIAGEAEIFQRDYSARLGEVVKDGNKAVAIVYIKGSDTTYGRLVPELTLKAALEQQSDGHWQVVGLSNVEEVFYPVVKGIEDYWTLQGWQ
ncbi:hypothetical protein [Selenomonas sp. AE3005]|uniref:hypothetical protein n=1 Tax=Selenomonas sp. AE3005 TaxID=1485543 RepID=UPI000484AD42|nr:hypothetical protein [Selenomonas sp. AE3005]